MKKGDDLGPQGGLDVVGLPRQKVKDVVHRVPEDGYGRGQDEGPDDQGRDALELPVSERVLFIGGFYWLS